MSTIMFLTEGQIQGDLVLGHFVDQHKHLFVYDKEVWWYDYNEVRNAWIEFMKEAIK